jgi:molecular chaperone GrpE (heat shock protein)
MLASFIVRHFRHWLAQVPRGSVEQERQLRLAAESELQQLRLELQQAQQDVNQLKTDLSRQYQQHGDILTEKLQVQLESILTPLASPLAQLLTQQYLIETKEKDLRVKDLLATSRRIWQALAPFGLEALETIDDVVEFAPDRHQSLNHTANLRLGEQVRIRIPGIAIKGKVLKAAAVDAVIIDELTSEGFAG